MGAGYRVQLLAQRLVSVFQVVRFVVKFELVVHLWHVDDARCDAHHYLKAGVVGLAPFLFAFADKEDIQMRLEQIAQLLCQVYPRAEHTKRVAWVLFEIFQHCVEHNVRLAGAARQLQFQHGFVAR